MKYIFILLSLLYVTVSHAQVDIINQSLTDSSLNIFYIGVDNRIKLKINKNIPEYAIAIKGAGGMLNKISQDEYWVRVNRIDSCKIIIARNGREVLVRKYKIDTVPDPVATISSLRNTTIKLNRLLLNPFITLILPGCYYRHRLYVVSFLATLIQGTDSVAANNTGNQFSGELIKAARQLVTGDQIYFNDIRAYGPDCRTRKLIPFWIKIE